MSNRIYKNLVNLLIAAIWAAEAEKVMVKLRKTHFNYQVFPSVKNNATKP
jgi:hypothetical protein